LYVALARKRFLTFHDMARLPFTDTHVHFHDLREPSLHYSWLTPDNGPDELLGDYSAIRAERYWADDFIAETRFQNVERVIHVQAAIGIADPVRETAWLQRFHDRLGVPHAAVAYVDLIAPDREDVLRGHLEHPITRGVRDFRYDGYLSNERWREGFGRLGELGLVCCDDPALDQVDLVAELAREHPGTTLCIDHACMPMRRDDEYFAAWKAALRTLAAPENVVMKISGLGQGDHAWTVDSLRPWVLECIEAFGVARCFFGTNWPVDRLFSSYGDVLDAYAEIIADLPEAEQRGLFSGNAGRIFRLDEPDGQS
jgi:predicted TIM-barrel fold metal-dependent hydrolase